ncbi:MAG: hypothetical protein OXD49_11885 [Candidatus Poribacteria bacterium]|nr:hypothetical protein [Candidatus Poribacteria bacterium]
MAILYLKGFIRDATYTSHLNPEKFEEYDITQFDVNQAQASGLIDLETSGNNLAFSKWVSPKRTRSYPFARIYNTFHFNTKKVTIIPIIKDEGADTNNDRINFITFSWMNLLNIYIILAWYEDAERKSGTTDRITNQILNAKSVREKLLEVSQYRMTALHWNTTHFEKDFESIYLNAVDGYKKISRERNVAVHSPKNHLQTLEKFKANGQFSLASFKEASLPSSYDAAHRESLTTHVLESLEENSKGVFSISNYLGGQYYLTADEVYWENDQLVIQESKNSSKGKLPSENDIKDGLFKLILFANMEEVAIDERTNIQFTTRLKLTGNLIGSLFLPCATKNVFNFCAENRLTQTYQKRLISLNQEASENNKLQIWITGRHA